MPPIEEADCNQTAVLWARLGTDKRGMPVLDSPTELTPPFNGVRWNTRRTQQLAPDGGTITLDGSAVVRENIAVGSQLWLGTLEEWYGTGSSSDDAEVMEVKTFNATPDIRNVVTRREVGLMRRRNR